jgi:hypothetical protein
VPEFKFTPYFENQILRKRPYLTKRMCIRVVQSPIRFEPQEQDRYRCQLGGSAGGLPARRAIQLGESACPAILLARIL